MESVMRVIKRCKKKILLTSQNANSFKSNCKSKGKYIAIAFESNYFTQSNTEKKQRTNTKNHKKKKKKSHFGCTNIIFANCTSINILLLYVKSVEPLKYLKIWLTKNKITVIPVKTPKIVFYILWRIYRYVYLKFCK